MLGHSKFGAVDSTNDSLPKTKIKLYHHLRKCVPKEMAEKPVRVLPFQKGMNSPSQEPAMLQDDH